MESSSPARPAAVRLRMERGREHERQVPKTIIDWFDQAERNTPEGKRHLLVLHPPRLPYEDSLVVLRLGDFVRANDAGDSKPHTVRLVQVAR